MIIFHEGLPRSGKSYEAMVYHIIPALKSGRPVQAYIEGLNFEKIAKVAGLSLEVVCDLLTQITEEQVKDVPQWAQKNSLVVIDEAQDFWPTGRQSLPEDVTKFVTQHGHFGLDLLLMGQDLRDVHNLWRRRVDTKIVFMKRDMIGKENTYKYTVYKARKTDKDTVFEQMSDGIRTYDKSYFGTYASHVDTQVQTGNYKDDRANIFKSKAFRFWVPLAGIVGFFAICYLIYMFKGGGLAKSVYTPPTLSSTASQPVSHPVLQALPPTQPDPSSVVSNAASAVAVPPKKTDYIEEISSKWRPRLSAWMRKKDGVFVLVEWFDGGLRKMEVMQAPQFAEFGYTVDVQADVLTIARHDGTGVQRITSWPIDPFGMVSQERRDAISAESRAPLSSSGSTAALSLADADTGGLRAGIGLPAKSTGLSAAAK